MSKHYQRYKQDPNFRDLTNRLLEVMEMYRWSSGDSQDQYEEWYHDAVRTAEQIHAADLAGVSLHDELLLSEKHPAADLGGE